MTIQETADMTHVCERTVRTWIQQGRLRATKIGSIVRICPGDLLDTLAAHRVFRDVPPKHWSVS